MVPRTNQADKKCFEGRREGIFRKCYQLIKIQKDVYHHHIKIAVVVEDEGDEGDRWAFQSEKNFPESITHFVRVFFWLLIIYWQVWSIKFGSNARGPGDYISLNESKRRDQTTPQSIEGELAEENNAQTDSDLGLDGLFVENGLDASSNAFTEWLGGFQELDMPGSKQITATEPEVEPVYPLRVKNETAGLVLRTIPEYRPVGLGAPRGDAEAGDRLDFNPKKRKTMHHPYGRALG